MAEAIHVEGPISGTDKRLSFETGKLAQQSQGAVVGRSEVTDGAERARPGGSRPTARSYQPVAWATGHGI